MRNLRFVVLTLAAFACLQPSWIARAQDTGAPKRLVLIPYQEPTDTDPYGAKITDMLRSDLQGAGIKSVSVDPIDHLDAVASAGKICSENGADGILIPEGRSEGTGRLAYMVLASTLTYEMHVEFRLDVVDCRGVVRRTTLATGDHTASGVSSPVSGGKIDVGGALDAAYQSAVQSAVQEFLASPPDLAPASAAKSPDPVPSPTVTSTLLLLPIGQPGLSDPNAAAVTNAVLVQMQKRNLNVTVGPQIDHLTAFAAAQQLCATNGVRGIIVPRLRLAQLPFSGQSGARLRLNLLACDGSSVAYGFGQAELRRAPKHDFSAAIVEAADQATSPAIDVLFPSTKT